MRKVAFLLAIVPATLGAYETGPPAGYTGAPGDNPTACISAGCHTGTPNSGPGNVKIKLPAGNSGTYVPGQAMQILVQITDSTKSAFGFELTARMGNGDNTQAGDLAAADADTQAVCFEGPKQNGKPCSATFPIQYIEHSFTGYEASTQASPKGSFTYAFNWTPPASGSGTVTLYAAANCGPGDPPAPSPTNVYTTKLSLTEGSGTTPPPTPTINLGGIGPIYSKATTIQPGSWISIYGTNLVSSLGVWDGSPPTPTTLGGASVTINNKPGYMWVAVPHAIGNVDQINVQAPDDTATGTVTVQVTNATNGTATSTVTLASVGPSFSVLGDAANHAAAVILTPDGSGAYQNHTYDIDGPQGNSLGYATRPVKAGETLVLYGVGFGPTNPAVQAGQPYVGAAKITNSLQITIGGVPVPDSDVQFAGIVGQGLYQINIVVPPGLGTGDKALLATVAGVQTPTGVVLAVQ
ncbi:MAG TPA: choice-of-anchor V domain-containing protein [Bryobacteraceae bacterium]|nr:choice-of-anchor V domain-containing protein [Bryobacteraceae bacterium]